MSTQKSSRKRSPVWLFFTSEDSEHAKCGVCLKNFSYKGGSVNNLMRHLTRVHHFTFQKDNYVECAEATSLTANEATESMASSSCVTPTSEPEAKKRKNDTAISSDFSKSICKTIIKEIIKDTDFLLLEVIVKNYLPFRIVECEHFQKFVSSLDSSYQMPDRKTITKSLLPQLYMTCHDKVKNDINSINAASLTIERWTSLYNESFVSVTVHFLGYSIMQTFVLECFQYSEQDTTIYLAKELKRICTEWNIHDKISAVITDSTDNIMAAIKIIGWKNLLCFARSLDLIVQNALIEIKDIHGKVKKIIEYFQKSPEAVQRLNDIQSQMGIESLTLKQDMVSKWSTTYDMFDRVLQVKDALLSVLTIYYPHVKFTSDDATLLKEVCEVLKVFKDIAEEMISEKEVMASKIILFVNALRKTCLQFVKSENSPVVANLVKKLSESINKKFKDVETNNVYAEATFLDPRFKKYGFSDKKYFEAAKKSIIAAIIKNIPRPVKKPQEESVNNGNSVWNFFDTCVAEVIHNSDPTSVAVGEIDKYLDEPLLPRQSNPLIWWEERQAVYPYLYEYMKKRMCVVGTSVPSEYVFSKSGQILIEKRNRLKGQKVPQIIFLNGNI